MQLRLAHRNAPAVPDTRIQRGARGGSDCRIKFGWPAPARALALYSGGRARYVLAIRWVMEFPGRRLRRLSEKKLAGFERAQLLAPLVIGVTGHRDLRDEDRIHLAAKVKEILLDLRKDYPATPLVV